KYLAEEEIPIPSEELHYEYSIVEDKENNKLKVLLAGIRKNYLYSLVKVFQESGFLVKEVRVSLLTWKNILRLNDEEITLIVLEDNAQINLVIYKGGTPQLIRAFEIQRLLFYLETYDGEILVRQILHGSGKRTEEIGKGIQEVLTRHLGKTPILRELDKVLEHSPLVSSLSQTSSPLQSILAEYPTEKLLTCVGMCGMGMPDMGTVRKDIYDIDFWRQIFVSKRNKLQKQIGASFLSVVMIAISLLFIYFQQASHALQNEVLQLRELEANAIEQQENSLRPLYSWERAERKKTSVGQELGALLSLKNESLQLKRIEIKGTSLLIEGNTGEALVVPQLFHQLRELNWMNIELVNYEFTHSPQTENSLLLPIKFSLKGEKHKVMEP
ncbi:MAG: hypothetical protein GX958_10365, partial [Desulfitobacterium sp.]|nr:hypothetical protein [Desulfitobacterium sp.]